MKICKIFSLCKNSDIYLLLNEGKAGSSELNLSHRNSWLKVKTPASLGLDIFFCSSFFQKLARFTDLTTWSGFVFKTRCYTLNSEIPIIQKRKRRHQELNNLPRSRVGGTPRVFPDDCPSAILEGVGEAPSTLSVLHLPRSILEDTGKNIGQIYHCRGIVSHFYFSIFDKAIKFIFKNENIFIHSWCN